MDLNILNKKLNDIANKIRTYLNNPYEHKPADFSEQQNGVYISNEYDRIVAGYSDLLRLITEVQFNISECKKFIRFAGATDLERRAKEQVKEFVKVLEELIEPLYNEKERLKTIEMFYRNLYNRFRNVKNKGGIFNV
jgi:CRISPR/Cas system CSM-associated protein Csm2 small subunit